MECRLWAWRRLALIAALAASLFLLVLWGDSNSEPHQAVATPPVIHEGRPQPLDPDWPIVYTTLQNKCIGCHRQGTERTDFSTYETIVNAEIYGEQIIVPGSAEDSLLWQYVAWNQGHPGGGMPSQPHMPPEREEWLTAGQVEAIKRWIDNGALEYELPNTCDISPLTEIDFPSARACANCHPKQYDEWSRSMHAYAQHSPIFEAFNLTLVERTSGTIGTFCTRCHTPIGTALGENESVRNVHRSRIAMEGVTCVVCHRRPAEQYKSSGRVSFEPGDTLTGCVYGPFDDAVSLEAGAHPSQGQPYLKSSQFCGECHDVTSPDGVRLEEAFSEWQNSPAAAQGITCQACHMGPVQGKPFADCERPLGRAAVVPGMDPEKLPLRHLSDHTFAGPDYSLLPDTEFPHKRDWMYEIDYRDYDSLSPYHQRSLDELRVENRESLAIAAAKRYEVLQNGARIHVGYPQQVRPGQPFRVGVDVESTFPGHAYPTGFTAERQLWVSIQIYDPCGKLLYSSGDLDPNADLRDDHSYAVLTGDVPRDDLLLNFQSGFIALANKGNEHSVVLSVNRDVAPLSFLRPSPVPAQSFGHPPAFRVARRSLPALETIGRHYPVRLNEPGIYTVDVRLNFRHLPPTLLDHIGVPHLKHLLEIVVIDSYHGTIVVGDGACEEEMPLFIGPQLPRETAPPAAEPQPAEREARQNWIQNLQFDGP